MNLREEIIKTLAENWAFNQLPEKIEQLFKKWALEMVGEDEFENVPEVGTEKLEDGYKCGYTDAQHIIRHKLEEAIK